MGDLISYSVATVGGLPVLVEGVQGGSKSWDMEDVPFINELPPQYHYFMS